MGKKKLAVYFHCIPEHPLRDGEYPTGHELQRNAYYLQGLKNCQFLLCWQTASEALRHPPPTSRANKNRHLQFIILQIILYCVEIILYSKKR